MLLLTVQQKESFCATPLKPYDRSKLVVRSLTSSGNQSETDSDQPSCPMVMVTPFTSKSCDEHSILKKASALYSRKYSSTSEPRISDDDSESIQERHETREPSASMFNNGLTPLNISSISDKVLRVVQNKDLADLLEQNPEVAQELHQILTQISVEDLIRKMKNMSSKRKFKEDG